MFSLPPLPPRQRFLLWGFFVLLLALAVHSPSLGNGLIGWDDQTTIAGNPLLGRLSIPRFAQYFTAFSNFDYYPVFYLSFWPERLLWEGNPFGHRLTSLLLHALNAALVYLLALKLLPDRKPARAAIVAAVWSLHPVTVEPVAWATGRKVLLSAFFSLLALLAHLRSGRGKAYAFRAAAVLLFALSCLSNVAAAATAAIFAAEEYACRRARGRTALIRAWPFFLIGIAAVLLKLWARRGHPEAPPEILWTSARWLPTALEGFGRNLAALLFPLRLGPRYASSLAAFPWPAAFWLGLSAAVLSLAGLRKLRPRSASFFALLWYLIALTPTFGLLRHHILRADRYLYLPAAALVLLGASAPTVSGGGRKRSAVLALAGLLCLETALTIRQTRFWRDDVALWSRALRIEPENALAFDYLGEALLGRGRTDEAIADFQRAIALRPGIADSHRNLGSALIRKGKTPEAVAAFRRAVAIQPGSAENRFRLAEALAESGNREEARGEYDEAIRLRPDRPEYRSGPAYLREIEGDLPGAEKLYREALGAFPGSWRLHNLLGINLFRQGRTAEAIASYEEALRLNPRFAEGWSNLGNARARSGNRPEAIRFYRRALEIQPDFAAALGNLGGVLSEAGRGSEAEECLLRARRLNPASPAIAYQLGALRFRAGRLAEAEPFFREALRRDPAFVEAARSLAETLARLGRAEEADRALAEAVAECRRRGGEAAAAEIERARGGSDRREK